MVMYEAARAICNLPGVEMNDLSPAITVLQVSLVLFPSALNKSSCREIFWFPLDLALLFCVYSGEFIRSSAVAIRTTSVIGMLG